MSVGSSWLSTLSPEASSEGHCHRPEPRAPMWRRSQPAHQDHPSLCPPALLCTQQPAQWGPQRGGSQDGGQLVHRQKKGKGTQPPERTAYTLPHILCTPTGCPGQGRMRLGDGRQMLQAGCFAPRAGAPASSGRPPGALRWGGGAGGHSVSLRLSSPSLSPSPGVPLTASAEMVPLHPCLSLHLLLVTSALLPSSSESSFPPPLLSLSLRGSLILSPPPPSPLQRPLPCGHLWDNPLPKPTADPLWDLPLVAFGALLKARPWYQRQPGGRRGPGGLGAGGWGLLWGFAGRWETGSSWALPCGPLRGRGEPSGGVCISPTSPPHLGAPGSSVPWPPLDHVEGAAGLSRRLTCLGWV